MAYTKDNNGIYNANVAAAWKKIAMWTTGDQVELIAEGNATLPNSMGAATSLAAFVPAFDGAVGAASGFATLDGTSKLTASQIPSSISGGMVYSGVVNATTGTLDTIATALGGTTEDTSKYVVVTTGGTIDDTATTAKWELNTYDDGVPANTAILEVGDIIFCTAYGTYHQFTIFSQTYGDAGTAAKGVVTLSDVATRATLAGDHVITEGILATILNDDLLVDGDFATSGYMKTDGSGGYSIDNNTFLTQVSFDSANAFLAALEATTETSGVVTKSGADTVAIDTTVLFDADFASSGYMKSDGAGTYSIDPNALQTQVTISAASPTGGVDNDIWVQTS